MDGYNLYHLDGSSCQQERKSSPTKAAIAKYWKGLCLEYFDYLMDWGEPSCWACGRWDHHYDVDLEKVNDVFRAWNAASYLERCHIMPRSLNGCNCEANFVLLCRDCHKESPDTKDLKLFQRWVRNRENVFALLQKKYTQAAKELDYEIEEGDDAIISSETFKEFLSENIVFVGGKVAPSSYIACLIEFKRMRKKM